MVRYLGYTNEVGESFRYIFPRFVIPSYGISFGYVFADSVDKYRKSYNKHLEKFKDGIFFYFSKIKTSNLKKLKKKKLKSV